MRKVTEKADNNPTVNENEQGQQQTHGSQGSPNSSDSKASGDDLSLVDELGIVDLDIPVYGGRGRVFSAAGRNAPVAEFTEDFLVLHPPQRPFEDEEAESEVIVIRMDDDGILINELGQRKKVPGAKFQGKEIFYYWEQRPGTMKHYGVFFDEDHAHHFMILEDNRLTVDVIFQLRNMTHDGELAKFTEISVE